MAKKNQVSYVDFDDSEGLTVTARRPQLVAKDDEKESTLTTWEKIGLLAAGVGGFAMVITFLGRAIFGGGDSPDKS